MLGSFSLAGFRSLGFEEEHEDNVEEEHMMDPVVEGRPRMLPLVTTEPGPNPGPSPLPLLLFLPGTGKGEVEAGLLAELCLLS